MSIPTWPSAPKALAAALFDKFGVGSTQLPYPLELPCAQVRRIGGADDGFLDRARVDVTVIHTDEDSAEALAEEIRNFLVDTKPIRGAGLLLEGAETEVGPTQVFYPDDPGWAEFRATYIVESRRL